MAQGLQALLHNAGIFTQYARGGYGFCRLVACHAGITLKARASQQLVPLLHRKTIFALWLRLFERGHTSATKECDISFRLVD